ncbi:hypothetical protein CVT25_013614 [Psilocybe cyanescens]|uniref:Uncharacterized protein n=1 Tax=Psilocybe cyanescens TaxID=93625 RepID=A0A409VYV7_PSICY|nr:hypothetical protein CVT25_013614 [Psilocybe cyanescens]
MGDGKNIFDEVAGNRKLRDLVQHERWFSMANRGRTILIIPSESWSNLKCRAPRSETGFRRNFMLTQDQKTRSGGRQQGAE